MLVRSSGNYCLSFWKIYFKFIHLNFSDMANIQNGFNMWYIALIQRLSLQYRDKCRIIFFQNGIKAKTSTSLFSEFISTENIDWVWFLRNKISIPIGYSWKLDNNRLCQIQPKTPKLKTCVLSDDATWSCFENPLSSGQLMVYLLLAFCQ